MKKDAAGKIFRSAFLLFAGILLVFPVIYCLGGSFMTEREFFMRPPRVFSASPSVDSYIYVLTHTPLPRYMLNSLITATLGTAVRLALSIPAAYALSFMHFKGERAVLILILGTMMLPPDSLIVANYLTVSRLGLTDTYIGMTIVYFVSAAQFLILRQTFLSMPPSMREAAAVDGCSDLRFMLKVAVPAAKPVVLTVMAQSFFTLWNVYLWPLIVTNSDSMRTVQVGITRLAGADDLRYGVVFAGIIVALLPSLPIFAIVRRGFAGGISAYEC